MPVKPGKERRVVPQREEEGDEGDEEQEGGGERVRGCEARGSAAACLPLSPLPSLPITPSPNLPMYHPTASPSGSIPKYRASSQKAA